MAKMRASMRAARARPPKLTVSPGGRVTQRGFPSSGKKAKVSASARPKGTSFRALRTTRSSGMPAPSASATCAATIAATTLGALTRKSAIASPKR